jgi:lipid II:glycine glycyltransferase (peptidoglycan interpeptide bridge formation enzyme)
VGSSDGSLTTNPSTICSDPELWDDTLRAQGGHLLQSWRWGEFKERFGWTAERIVVQGAGGLGLAQLLFRSRFGVSLGYIPRGPVLPPADRRVSDELWERVDRLARRRRTLTVIVEPDLALLTSSDERRFSPGPAPIQPARTVKVTLHDDEGLLAQMHPKMRYNVRLAKRRGVLTREADDPVAGADIFYAML